MAAAAGSGEGDTVLVGVRGYDSGHREKKGGSTATSRTSNGRPIEMTFWNEAPPALSHFSVHGSDLPPAHGAKVIAAADGFLLLRVPVSPLPGGKRLFRHDDYFVYNHHQPATLYLLPSPCPQYCIRDDDFVIVSCGDKQQYVVAALEMISLPSRFALHLYKSSSSSGGGDEIAGSWTCEEVFVEAAVRDKVCPIPDSAERPVYHITTKTITLGGPKGTVGWVDLWRGILLCDLLDETPKLRDMPLPLPAKGNWTSYLCDSESFRDITVSQHKDSIKYVEMEITLPRVVTKTISVSSGDRTMPDSCLEWVRRSREPKPQPTTRQRSSVRWPGHWRLTTWTMPIPVTSWEDWRPDCTANSHDFHVNNPADHELLNKLMLSTSDNDNEEEAKGSSLSLGCLRMCYPALSIDGDDVVYLLCNSANKDCNRGGVMIAIDVRKKEIQGAAKLDRKKNTLFCIRCYLATAISKHPTSTAEQYQESLHSILFCLDKLRSMQKPPSRRCEGACAWDTRQARTRQCALVRGPRGADARLIRLPRIPRKRVGSSVAAGGFGGSGVDNNVARSGGLDLDLMAVKSQSKSQASRVV
uniref:DUF1618 domain-containing protein n=1 Tax=Oryza punctata TaxID=4537 RepID=A0A0E0LFS4_ORYPU